MNRAAQDISWFKAQLANTSVIERLKKIRLIFFDVDGCLTPGTVHFTELATRGKTFSIQDGIMIKAAMNSGINCAIISGRSSNATIARCKELGFPDELCVTGFEDKYDTAQAIMKRLGCTQQNVLVFGDDLPDLTIKKCASVFATPSNGVFYVQHQADLVVDRSGANGGARLLLDLVLYVQDKHPASDLLTAALG